MDGFGVRQASRLTGCTPRQLRYWDEIGFVGPSVQGTTGRPGHPRIYSFRDLVVLRVVRSLLDQGMSLQQVRRAFAYLAADAGLAEDLAATRLLSEGRSILQLSREGGGLVDALRHGQMALFARLDESAHGIPDSAPRPIARDRDRLRLALAKAEHAERSTGTQGTERKRSRAR